jgi:hypothetical protein
MDLGRAGGVAAQDDQLAVGSPGQRDRVIEVVRQARRGNDDGVEQGPVVRRYRLRHGVPDELRMGGVLADLRSANRHHRLACRPVPSGDGLPDAADHW